MNANGRIRFGILGPLVVTRHGVDVDVGGPKPRALLISLLTDPGRPVSVGRLIDQVWDGAPPKRASASLHAYVSNLRKALDGGSLVRGAAGYALTIEPAVVDAVRFEAHVAAGTLANTEGDHDRARKELDAGLALWRGPALADVADTHFGRVEAARLDELRITATEERAASMLALGDVAAAVPELERLVADHPLRERLRALLVIGLYRGGRQVDALAQLRLAREVLAEEAGVDPGPTLTRLEARVLRQDPALDHAPTWQEPGPRPQAATAPPRLVAVDRRPTNRQPAALAPVPLVGRGDAMATLEAAWATAVAGHGQLVLVSGEAGIGKSRLVEAVAALVEDTPVGGVRAHWGRCFETAGAPVFWPWAQVIRSIIGGLADGALGHLAPTTAGELAQIVPELHELVPGATPPPSLDPLDGRFQLLRAIVSFVVDASAARPVLIVLEDVHWADDASLDVLRVLAPAIATSRVLLLVTHRDAPADHTPGLRAMLGALVREPAVSAVRLGALGPADLTELTRVVLGSAGTDAVAGAVLARSDGNPLHATQLLRVVGDDGLPDRVPLGLQQLLHGRVEALPPATVTALEAAAVIGREFTVGLVAAVSRTDPAELLDALDPAAQAGVVTEVATGDRYRFAHVLVRDALYEALPPGRRTRLHAAIGEALEDDPVRVAEAAHHLGLAGGLGLASRAADAAVRAADRAHGLYAFADEEAHLRHALSLIGDDPGREVSIQARLASVLLTTQGYTAAGVRDSTRRIAALTNGRGEAELAAWACWVDACVRADFPATIDIAEEAVGALAPSSGPGSRAAAHQMMGTTLWHLGRVRDAAEAFDRSLAHLAEMDPAALTSPVVSHVTQTALCHSAANLFALGDHAEARRRLARAVELGEPAGPFAHAFARESTGYVGALFGDGSGAADARWALETVTTHDFRQLAAMVVGVAGWHRARGEDDPAGIEDLRASLELMEAVGVAMMRPAFLRCLGDALEHHARPDEARTAYEDGLAAAELTGEHMLTADLLWRRGRVARALGESDGGWFDRAVSLAGEQGAAHLGDLAERERGSAG